ncbi:hypothetical protein [Blastococcus capsensis]|uniref:hypothetical protein n=1 Tax=Blastococcus capsensis TaxID=1564163 RepID=UPI002540D554|nr:hypothetical protein [Blastococcus capsensis]MDK3258732.1 hypothetical protein [Blastococcus capsensis]
MNFFLAVIAALGQIVLGFYGFWLVWRVLLPGLPGPAEPDKRIAPFAGYFTDPFVQPLATRLHVPPRLVAMLALVVVATASAALARLPQLST